MSLYNATMATYILTHLLTLSLIDSGNDNRAHRPNGTDPKWAAQTPAYDVNILNNTVRKSPPPLSLSLLFQHREILKHLTGVSISR